MPNSDSLKIYFDGDCPLCKREMKYLKSRDKAEMIELVDIASPDFNPESTGRTKAELMARIHASLPNNELIEGVEVFRQAYSRVGLGWILWITQFPVFKQLADIFYLIFAKNRLRFGRLFGRCVDGQCSVTPDDYK